MAGVAGTASSTLVFSDVPNAVHASTVSGNAYSYGGAGGDGHGSAAGTAGGTARSYASLTGTRGVAAQAEAVRGGAGGVSGAGLTGAAGGTATAQSYARSSTTTAGDKVTSFASTYGGAGGAGYTTGGNGGAGGAAIGAKAGGYATGVGNTAYALGSSSQHGGGGGIGEGAGDVGGAGGTASGTVATASGFNVKVRASQTGGSGGQGGNGASGGAGAYSKLVNVLTGQSSGGLLYLGQYANGGNGGNANANGGAGGYATSMLAFNDLTNPVQAATLRGKSYAVGGSSGESDSIGGTAATSVLAGANAYAGLSVTGANGVYAQNAHALGGAGGGTGGGALTAGKGGTASGNALASSTTTGTQGVSAGATAYGGSGGVAGAGTGNGGAGGVAAASYANAQELTATGGVARATVKQRGGAGGEAFGTVAGQTGGAGGIVGQVEHPLAVAKGFSANAVLEQYGGRGGAGGNISVGANGGTGASDYVTNGVYGKTTGGYLALSQSASAGGGGNSAGGLAGAAGNAGSYLTFADTTASTLSGITNATGGYGGGGTVNAAVGGTAYAADSMSGVHQVSALARATGGGGGSVSGTGLAGAGGAARSHAYALGTNAGTQTIGATAVTFAGAGGDTTGSGNGGQGGAATYAKAQSLSKLDTQGEAYAAAQQSGGGGGIGTGAGNHGGAGGIASGTVAQAAGGYSAVANVSQTGGAGGSGRSGAAGGMGAASSLKNATSVSTQGLGPMSMNQTATGGAGGASAGGTAGQGGAAYSYLSADQSALQNKSTSINVTAMGGAGGYGSSGSNGAAGGAAGAYGTLIGLGPVGVIVAATGGAGGASSLSAGIGGAAIATASSSAVGSALNNTATANANATAGTGSVAGNAQVTATAVTASGQVATALIYASGLQDTASAFAASDLLGGALFDVSAKTSIANGAGVVRGTSMAEIGQVIPFDEGAVDYAFADQLPSVSSVDNILSTRNGATYSAVAAVLGPVDTAATELGYGWMGAVSQASTGTSQTVTSSESYYVTAANGTGKLYLGLLSGTVEGSGFTNLAFTVTVGTTVVVNQNFTSNVAAAAYFSNDAINLGTLPGGLATNVTVSFTVTSATQNSGFDANLLLGSTGVNGPPVFAGPGTALAVGQGLSTAVSGLGLSEAGNLAGETFSIQVQDTTGVLSATGLSALYSLSNGGTTLSMTNATLSQVQQVLGALHVTEPVGSETADTLVLTGSDSLGGTATAEDVAIAVTGVPSFVAPAASVGIGKASAIGGVSLSESGSHSAETFSVTLTDTSGLLSFSTAAGMAAVGAGGTISGQGSKSLTVSGSFTAVNDALAGLTETESGSTPDTIVLNGSDSHGNSAAAANLAVTVNGAPVISAPVNRVFLAVDQPTTIQGYNASYTSVLGISVTESGTIQPSTTVTVDVNDSAGSIGQGIAVGGVTYTQVSTSQATLTGSFTLVTQQLGDITAQNIVPGTITVSATDSFANVATPVSLAVTVQDTVAQVEALTTAEIAALGTAGVTSIPVAYDNGATLDLSLAQVGALLTAGIAISYPSGTVALADTAATLLSSITPDAVSQLSSVGVTAITTTGGALVFGVGTMGAIVTANTASGLRLTSATGVVTLSDTVANVSLLSVATLIGLAQVGVTGITATFVAGGPQNVTFTVQQAQALVSATGSGYPVLPVTAPAGGIVVLSDTAAQIEALQPSDYANGLAFIGIGKIAANDASLAFSVAQLQAISNFHASVSVPGGFSVTVQDLAANVTGLLDGGSAGGLLSIGPIVSLIATDGPLVLSAAEAEAMEAANQLAGTSATLGAVTGGVTVSDTAADIEAMSAAQLGGLSALGVSGINVTDTGLTLTVAQALGLYDPVSITVPAGTKVVVADTEAQIDLLTQAEITGLAGLGVNQVAVSNITGLAPLTIAGGVTLAIDGPVPSGAVIDFAGPGTSGAGTLSLNDTPGMQGTVEGFSAVDTVDLTDAVYDPSASAVLGANNVLTVNENSGSYNIQLDPAQTFLTTPGFVANADAGTGTAVSYTQAAVNSYALVGQGQTVNGVVIASGGLVEVAAGIADRTVIQSGGTLEVDSGGLATDTTIGGGSLDLNDGAVTSGAIVFAVPGNGSPGGVLSIGGTSMPAAVISGFTSADTIDLAGIADDPSGTATLLGGNILQVVESGTAYDITLDPAASYTGDYFHLASDSVAGTNVTENGTPCYCPGTLILTEHGEVPVEALAIGMRVMTIGGRAAADPLDWKAELCRAVCGAEPGGAADHDQDRCAGRRGAAAGPVCVTAACDVSGRDAV